MFGITTLSLKSKIINRHEPPRMTYIWCYGLRTAICCDRSASSLSFSLFVFSSSNERCFSALLFLCFRYRAVFSIRFFLSTFSMLYCASILERRSVQVSFLFQYRTLPITLVYAALAFQFRVIQTPMRHIRCYGQVLLLCHSFLLVDTTDFIVLVKIQ